MSMLIAIGGHTGTGKTTLAYALREGVPALCEALVVEDDQTRREILARSIRDKLSPEDYSSQVTQQVREKLDNSIREALKSGKIVIDASGFFKQEQRKGIEALSHDCGVSFVGLWLVAPRSVMEARIQKRTREREEGQALSVEKGHASDACLGVIDKYGDIGTPSPEQWSVLDSEPPVDDIVAKIRERFLP